jgi:hypothetical protein
MEEDHDFEEEEDLDAIISVTESLLSISQSATSEWLDEELKIRSPKASLTIQVPLDLYSTPKPDEMPYDTTEQLWSLWLQWKEKWRAMIEFRRIVPSYETNLRYRTLHLSKIRDMRRDLFGERSGTVMQQAWVKIETEPMLLLDFRLKEGKLIAFDGNHRYYAFSKDAPDVCWHCVVVPMTEPNSPSLHLIRMMAFRMNTKNSAQIAPITRLEYVFFVFLRFCSLSFQCFSSHGHSILSDSRS